MLQKPIPPDSVLVRKSKKKRTKPEKYDGEDRKTEGTTKKGVLLMFIP